MTKYILFILIVLSSCQFSINAQTPVEDPAHYVIDTQDGFTSFNSSLWNIVPNNTWGLETYSAANVNASAGTLTLKCEKIGNNYISGGIETVGKKSFSYGYFEIESKTPTSGNKGPWGGFWMHTGEGGWDEIDVFEPNGDDTYLGTQFHSGTSATHNAAWNGTAKVYTGFPNLSASFNKYALIWTPKYVKVLVNNNLVYEVVDSKYIPTHPMFVFLTFQIDAWGGAPNQFTSFPLFWQFKNFKYYKLKTDCGNGITQSNFNFSSHDYNVQKFYSLSNSTIPNNSNIVLRATDYIELNGEFFVPLGSTFTATTHCNVCPD
ncbi:glycoside hydrolase family 16 protein [Fluviicola sp.]|uniref:glycoside hydrolase family 16 protein n=1 Tax=Fluviicola sp. TaxID=1917219 RepID=UPI00261CE3DF|nr:glycoside hydrolase family 16 protein [Fluviicola sp.]